MTSHIMIYGVLIAVGILIGYFIGIKGNDTKKKQPQTSADSFYKKNQETGHAFAHSRIHSPQAVHHPHSSPVKEKTSSLMGRSSTAMEEEKRNFAETAVTGFLVIIIAFAAFALFFSTKIIFFPTAAASAEAAQNDHFGAGGFTEYDLALANKIMDKDGDGICDVCGMDMNFCIENGQIQCNMGAKDEKLNIGILDKTKQKHHHHADFAVFIRGEPVDFAKQDYFVKSRFMHVENDPQGDTGKVLHMHASGVPLWLFFESIGMNFAQDCFTLESGEQYCNDRNNTLKFYVNGKPNSEFGDYVFQDNDQILISYGSRSEDLRGQLSSVTQFAPNH